ncbi:MAG: hypothetical protein GX434_08535 [Peptococcaceae bacterium]|nr:hypothetical protein [Peptococcaceae bacterium]
MKRYTVSAHEFYDGLKTGKPKLSQEIFVDSYLKCQKPMDILIKRYGLFNKCIISIGGSYGHEEYWLYKIGNNMLSFVDIDEDNVIESYLAGLETPVSKDENLVYYIGDARNVNEYKEDFEVIYFSGFTPNEIRTADILARNDHKWPNNELPFHQITIDVTGQLLAPGGLLILQSYCGGITYNQNPHCIGLIEKQLASVGIILLDLYYWKESPGISLLIGYKGTRQDADRYFSSREVEISDFHGRGRTPQKSRPTIIKYYDYSQGIINKPLSIHKSVKDLVAKLFNHS